MEKEIPIKTALISVFNKAGVVAFATFLHSEYGVRIISTGGTAKAIREAHIPVTDISEHTGFPECFDGRVKTLHPLVHGGLLYVRGNDAHELKAQELKITPIDLVVVNLYPFVQTTQKPGVTYEEVVENIDIGGPAMIRSAAKNHDSVAVVTNPDHYAMIQNQMVATNGSTGFELRRKLARDAYLLTGGYDNAIATYLQEHHYGAA